MQTMELLRGPQSDDARAYWPLGADGAAGLMLSAAAAVLGRYLCIASTVCVGNATMKKAEATTPIAMPMPIFNIQTPQSKQFQTQSVNEVADHGKTSDLAASQLPLACRRIFGPLQACMMTGRFERFRSQPAMIANIRSAADAGPPHLQFVFRDHSVPPVGRAAWDRSGRWKTL